MQARIFLFIGPKGSGKSFAGQLLQEQFNIPFLRVEDIALQVKQNRAVTDATYVAEVFQAIEQAVRTALQKHDRISFESTGLSDAFDQMLLNLRADFPLMLIRLHCDPESCLERVKTRDQHIHVNVSDAQVLHINRLVMEKALPCDVEIDNTYTNREFLLQGLQRLMATFS